MLFQGPNEELLQIETVSAKEIGSISRTFAKAYTALWNVSGTARLLVDGIDYTVPPGEVVFLSASHRLAPASVGKMRVIRFNSPFYCIVNHDREVGCKGLLFYGTAHLPFIGLESDDAEQFELLWQMFNMEMLASDELKMEMLQMLLRRFMIRCTRLYKEQNDFEGLDGSRYDLVREFNFQVELHFRSKHLVSDYAQLLNRAPKTITNTFAQLRQPNPLQIIHDRLLLEARRQLRHTDRAVKEIGYELGFKDVQTFSRFFKNGHGDSPTAYREQ